jgi:hypothetical protein
MAVFNDDLFTPSQFQGAGEFSYRCYFLPEAGSGTDKAIKAEIERVAREKWPKEWQKILTANEGNPNKHCYIDGEKLAFDGYTGLWRLSASRPQKKGAPLRYDQKKNLLDKNTGLLYSGCYVNGSVAFWCQDNNFGRAVRCELLGVQYFREGDAFAGGSKPNPDDFDDISEGADAAADLA